MSQPEHDEHAAPGHLWVFVIGDVPERWRDRARSASLIPLLPDEAASVLSSDGADVDASDDTLLNLAARGLPAPSIARTAGISIRTVHRRLARLREQFEVETTAQLASELSRRGFGG